MREIKFRAWNDELKCFVPPEVFAVGFTGNIWQVGYDENDIPIISTTKLIHLSQYTGLKDKNGKEVYEGDIIKWKDGLHKLRAVVGFENYIEEGDLDSDVRILGFCAKYNDGEFGIGTFPISEVEVIGNIYENPELLKGAE